MATYIVGKEISISRQEGDTAEISFIVPTVIDMSSFTEIKFWVKSSHVFIRKSLTNSDITLSGQTITIPLLPSDTKGKVSGKWELEISNDSDIITIGRGSFTIIPELIT